MSGTVHINWIIFLGMCFHWQKVFIILRGRKLLKIALDLRWSVWFLGSQGAWKLEHAVWICAEQVMESTCLQEKSKIFWAETHTICQRTLEVTSNVEKFQIGHHDLLNAWHLISTVIYCLKHVFSKMDTTPSWPTRSCDFKAQDTRTKFRTKVVPLAGPLPCPQTETHSTAKGKFCEFFDATLMLFTVFLVQGQSRGKLPGLHRQCNGRWTRTLCHWHCRSCTYGNGHAC